MKFLALTLLLGTASSQEVAFNTDKLLDFQTDISFVGAGELALGGPGHIFDFGKLDLQGHLQLDLASGKTHIALTSSVFMNHQSPGNPFVNGDGFSELFIDTEGRRFAVRESVWQQTVIGSVKGNLCFSGQLAPNIDTPSVQMVKNTALRYLKQAETGLNGQLESWKSNGIATVASGVVTVNPVPGTKLVFRTDGTPIEITHIRGEKEDLDVDIKFSNFVKGANVGTGFECEGISEINSQFDVSSARSVALLQIMVDMLAKHPETEILARALPNPATLFMQKPADDDATTSQQVLTFVAGSVFGGALVIAVARAFKRKMERSEPLLSDASQ